MCHSASPVIRNPVAASQRACTCEDSRPTTGMVTINTRPPGESTRPASSAVYPASSCINKGSKAVAAYSATPSTNIIKLAAAKLKFLNSRSSITGDLCRSSQTINATIEMIEIAESVAMK
jgi:hypothetical protein